MIGFGIYVVKNLAYTTLLKRLTVATRDISRAELIKQGLRVAAHNPALGVGLGNFQLYSTLDQYAHNNYVELLADTGLAGAILYYGIYVCIISKLFKLRKQIKSPMLKMILIYILFDLLIRQNFGVTYPQKETYIFLAVAVGYLNNCSQDQSSLNTVQSDSSY
jgi:O-antigen ligase